MFCMSIEKLTLIVLAAQALIYALMLWQMIKTAKATTEAANAAMQAVKTSSIIERAIVLIDSAALNTTEPEYRSVVLLTFKNFGRTTAYSVELNGGFYEFAELTGKSCGLGNWRLEKAPSRTIAPQGTSTWVTECIGTWINDEDIRMIKSRIATLRYSMDVTYTDAFGNPHQYHCEGQYDPTLKTFVTTSSTSD